MDPLRVFLLAGMLFHKLVWEFLKRGTAAPPGGSPLVKAAKVCVLLGLIGQVFAPAILPLSSEAAVPRAAGGVLFTAGLAIAVIARIQLGRNWADIEDATLLGGQEIVDKGLYAIIRHPIYTGDLLLVAGLELALNSWLVLLVAPLALAVRIKVAAEEQLLREKLRGYSDYCARTGRFLPRLLSGH